jgi:hypothetical protein
MSLLFAVFCIVYGYFFQGGGWNPNSHFDTIRAIVERRALDITPIAANTGDIAIHKGKTYSNKGPGFAVLGAPIYYVLYHVERKLGYATDDYQTVNLNAQVLTFLLSGLPGALLVLLLYRHFRSQEAAISESLCLAGAFGAGSLIFPYAGILMSHVLSACLLFATWQLVSRPNCTRLQVALAGLVCGVAVTVDTLSTPTVLLFSLYVLFRRPIWDVLSFAAAASVIAALYLTYNKLTFGSTFTSNQTLQGGFQNKDLVLGMLAPPDFERLYWLTVHPFRGLFYACPVMLLALLSLPRKWRLQPITLESVVPLAIIFLYLAFNLTFNGWAGGWGIGPRYLIPMFPFLFSFALRGFRSFGTPALALMAVSTVIMFSVSAVQLMVPAPNDRVDQRFDPVSDSVRRLKNGEISASTQSMLDFLPTHTERSEWASYNLGEVVGLEGLTSLVPVVLILLAFMLATLGFYWQRE